MAINRAPVSKCEDLLKKGLAEANLIESYLKYLTRSKKIYFFKYPH
jgi:hypothetical protein